MRYNSEQVLNGLISYADHEIIDKLPTTGKWVVGTAIGMMSNKAEMFVDNLKSNAIVQMLGIVDEDGMIDADALISSMKSSADKYGKISVDVPLIGRLSFSSSDVDSLRNYIV